MMNEDGTVGQIGQYTLYIYARVWVLGLQTSRFAAIWLYLAGKGQRYYQRWCYYDACGDGEVLSG